MSGHGPKFRTIVADPPWDTRTGPLGGGMGEGFTGGNGRNRPLGYPTMSLREIAALPILDLADPEGAHLYLWTINGFLEESFGIVREWGFEFSTLITWAKKPMGSGLGGAWGLATEHVLFCRRGRCPDGERIGRNWFDWKRPYRADGKPDHSRKPDAFLDHVERVSPPPRVELFARRARFGWDYWGNESLQTVEMPA